MRLTVIGSGGGTSLSEAASSSYLIHSGPSALLVECGPGVATRLRRSIRFADLAGVVLSHMHFENFYDLLPLAIKYYGHTVDAFVWEEQQPEALAPRTRLPVYLPPGGAAYLRGIMGAIIHPSNLATDRTIVSAFATALDLREYAANIPFAVGPFTVQLVGPVVHEPGPCFGMRVVDGDATLGYSGDSAMCDPLYDIAREADLFLCNATGITSEVRRSRHLSADEAGRIAFRAGAKRLLLTHLANTAPSWIDALIAAAALHYDGDIRVARDGNVLDIPSAHTSLT